MTNRLCKTSEVTESGREFRISGNRGDWFVMVFKREERLLAYQNVCPHRYLSLSWSPDRFMVGSDGMLVCPHHGAVFDLASGLCIQGPCSGDQLIPVKLRIEDDYLWVD